MLEFSEHDGEEAHQESVASALNPEEEQWLEVFESLRKSMMYYLRCKNFKEDEAEEVIQEVATLVFAGNSRKLLSYDRSASFRVWIFAVLRNRATDLSRPKLKLAGSGRVKRYSINFDPSDFNAPGNPREPESREINPVNTQIKNEIHDALHRAIESLPDTYRKTGLALLRHDTAAQISAEDSEKTPEATIRWRKGVILQLLSENKLLRSAVGIEREFRRIPGKKSDRAYEGIA